MAQKNQIDDVLSRLLFFFFAQMSISEKRFYLVLDSKFECSILGKALGNVKFSIVII